MNELNCHENCIEWLNGDGNAYFTFSQKKYINRVEKLSKKYPEKCVILARNSDGSVTGHISTKAVGFNQLALKNHGETPSSEDEDDEEDVDRERNE